MAPVFKSNRSKRVSPPISELRAKLPAWLPLSGQKTGFGLTDPVKLEPAIGEITDEALGSGVGSDHYVNKIANREAGPATRRRARTEREIDGGLILEIVSSQDLINP